MERKSKKTDMVSAEIGKGVVAVKVNDQPSAAATTQGKIAQAKARIAELEAQSKKEAEASLEPARKAYQDAVEQARLVVQEAKAKLDEATRAAGLKVNGGKVGPRSDAARYAVAEGARLNRLAGAPKADVVKDIFGTVGYALSWIKRAEHLQISPDDLCRLFSQDPEKVRGMWANRSATR
jgi:hypothetical protein